jgi:predicted GIY-YIG superfamily endonuclease
MTNKSKCVIKNQRRPVEHNLVVDLDGSVKYSAGWQISVPSVGGVYIIHDLRGSLYAGRSNNLRRRFDEHRSNFEENVMLRRMLTQPMGHMRYSWIEVEGEEQKSMERRLIRALNPLCNHLLVIADRASIKTKGEI